MKGVVLTAVFACAACVGRPGADREVRLQRLEADHRTLLAQLEDLQVRLLVDAERVRFWEEMRDRHESVSAIACTSQEAHAVAMAEYLQHQETLEHEMAGPQRQARVASLRGSDDDAVRPR